MAERDAKMKKLLYFGCLRDVGHFLWLGDDSGMICSAEELEKKTGIKAYTDEIFWGIDGRHVPKNTKAQGAAKESIVPPFRIVAWHDYTIDHRGASNSALLGFGYESAEEMLADAAIQYPSVIKRQTKPIEFVK